ncbi:hypothetical protein EV363DRAFT_1260848 [Boletus edulis]|uniref:Gfd2/YDR514C-like C-terminal domain-containing protein n=1 Tax=Boletus edulis BED1 TaxID=1328754 RepID=A0AAD4BNE6_BOLED|nr:hypothetical protein EV363DRAFT_1260848 [Boletus edulis]KAF8435828.1 hypothetical protein L210DRAFT_3484288 [Boletus edulis BED1]
MSDFHLVDPQGWVYDIQSVYSGYIGYFQHHGVPWHDRTWGQFFETFEQFLAFSWPVITVTDARTGRAHIVTRMNSITSFLKMIKMRFGEALPQVDNILLVKPLETSQRHLRHVNDWPSYKKLHSALPAVALAALKTRVRGGDPNAIRELWATRDKTFLAIDFECLERHDRSYTEWGYAAIRSSHLQAVGAWPPVPSTNYRKGHYIVAEYAGTMNKTSPSLSWQYAFGESQVIPKAKMPRIIQSVLSGLVSPDSDTVANNVVLVGHGVQALMQRLEDMKIQLPNNILVLDIAYFERTLFVTGERGSMVDRKSGRARVPESLLSLGSLLHSFGIGLPCVLHNAGNDAFMTLVTFQRMVGMGGAVPVAVHAAAAKDTGTGRGTGEGKGKGGVPNGNGGQGHVKRAATIAARFFRPGGTRPNLAKNGNGNANTNGNGKGNGQDRVPQTHVSHLSADGVDELGINVNTTGKRASVLSTWTSPLLLPTDKRAKKRASQGSLGGNNGKWLSPSTMLPGQRRHSAMILRSVNEGEKGE